MKRRVLAIGLDSADVDVIGGWLDAGDLPFLRRLRDEGAWSRVRGTVRYGGTKAPHAGSEALWVMFHTGLLPHQTGYWSSIQYDSQHYTATSDSINGGYDYREHRPFYALGDRLRVITFDVPVSRPCDDVSGLQVVGWGGHAPFVRSESRPAGLLDELNRRYGRDELLHNDHGEFWNDRYLDRLLSLAQDTVARQSAICRDLMQRDSWDLLLMAFGVTHSAAHDFWFKSRSDHPLSTGGADNSMLAVYQAVDRAIEEIVSAAPADTTVLCYSLHGMGPNVTDVASMAILPEVLYRWNFPGRVALAPGTDGAPPPPVTTNLRDFWGAEVWRRRHEAGRLRTLLKSRLPAWAIGAGDGCELESPYRVGCRPPNLGWMPAAWYRGVWPKMKAFALPAFTDGLIRVNVTGRDGHGIVAPQNYEGVCDDVTALLRRLRHGRTAEPVVEEVYRTRSSPLDDSGGNGLAADLVVRWKSHPFDLLDSPDVGRVGPLPYYRTGGHRAKGFLIGRGPEINGQSLADGEAIDLAPTILNLLGLTPPDHLPGRSLVCDSA
jgi:predicted AlkP superfamily phosphohydrolase/phosphomutase